MVSLNAIITLVILVLVIVIGYYIYAWFATLPITNCAVYGTIHTIGEAGGPICDPGAESYGGLCYNDVWTEEGGTKTAICTVEYPQDYHLYTDCSVGIQDLYIGDACDKATGWPPNMGLGWHKTALCTCQQGGVVTASQYCVLSSDPTPIHCPDGSDYFESACYSTACPSGYKRSEICTCEYIADLPK